MYFDLFADEPKKHKDTIKLSYPHECENCKLLKQEIKTLSIRLALEKDPTLEEPKIYEGWLR